MDKTKRKDPMDKSGRQIYTKALALYKKKKVTKSVLQKAEQIYTGERKPRRGGKAVFWSELKKAANSAGKTHVTAKMVRALSKKIVDRNYDYIVPNRYRKYAMNFQIDNSDMLLGNLGLLIVYSFEKPLKEYLAKNKGMKVQFSTRLYGRPNSKVENAVFYVSLNPVICLTDSDIKATLQKSVSELKVKIEERQLKGTGWKFKYVGSVFANVIPYTPLAGSSYVELPSELKNRKAVINVKNRDNRCFEWAVLSALYADEVTTHPERCSHYKKHQGELQFGNMTFPVKVEDIKKFEHLNKDISVNVFTFDTASVYPLRITDNQKENKMKEFKLLSNNKQQINLL